MGVCWGVPCVEPAPLGVPGADFLLWILGAALTGLL